MIQEIRTGIVAWEKPTITLKEIELMENDEEKLHVKGTSRITIQGGRTSFSIWPDEMMTH